MISKLLLPQDKANHFLYGTLAATAWALGAIYAPMWFPQHPANAAIAASLTLGVGKELLDRFSGKGTPDPMDAIATALGGAPIALVCI